MAKRLEKVSESADFRPFKFRIQAFTNAFQEEVRALGFDEDTLPVRKLKSYLWNNRLVGCERW
jgi:hypothetical protein